MTSTLCWNELYTADPEASKAFYRALPGREFQDSRDDGGGSRWLLFFDPRGASCHGVQLNRPEPWLEHLR